MLIGSLAAITIGYRLVALDRKSGVMPLIGTRPLDPGAHARGKILALCGIVGVLIDMTKGDFGV